MNLYADDEEIAAKAIVAAGGYEKFFMSHITAPGAHVFERIQPMHIPNYSVRMSALTAATIRPQIKELPARIAHANKCYELICQRLMSGAPEVRLTFNPCNKLVEELVHDWCTQRLQHTFAHKRESHLSLHRRNNLVVGDHQM